MDHTQNSNSVSFNTLSSAHCYIDLPILEKILNNLKPSLSQKPLQHTAVFYVHHPLQTSLNVIDAIVRLGAGPKNIFILGKRYSECSDVVDALVKLGVHYQPCSMQINLGKYSYSFIRDINWLWAQLVSALSEDIREILILDHGGHAVTYFPPALLNRYKVVAIEKTSAGFIDIDKRGLPPFPMIDVANCAAKRFIESPLIASAVVNKIVSYLPKEGGKHIYGVVGFGSIGQAITYKLLNMGYRVVLYDNDPAKILTAIPHANLIPTQELSALVSASNYIFGCSGRDIAETILEHFRLSKSDKTLISCSSEDKEFLSLLRIISHHENYDVHDPLDNIDYKSVLGANICILRGGFPVNFDQSGESVPAKDIQLTRSLVLASILQAIQYFKLSNSPIVPGIYSLDAVAQSFIVDEWLKHQDSSIYPEELIHSFHDIEWIMENSNGVHEHFDLFQ